MKSYIISSGNVPSEMRLYGLLDDLTRMPRDVAATVSPAVESISRCPTGGRVRFISDSSRITLRVTLKNAECNSGCGVLCDGEDIGLVRGGDDDTFYEGTLEVGGEGEHLFTVFAPRTAPLAQMEILLDDDATVRRAPDYEIECPIVFYGSSITQGAVSSSPARSYSALVAERMGANHINLGFGGNAKGEIEMAQYIASLEMSAFVMEYDDNADTLEDLRRTHKPFFDTVRRAHPKTPILILSRPDTDREFVRSCYCRRIIMDTFHAALDDGDRMVDYVDGFYLWGSENRAECTSDDKSHPTEYGSRVMASVIAPRLRSLMNRDPNMSARTPDGELCDFSTVI